MIKLEHISKWVNQGNIRNFILKDINLQIGEGEFISVMGPSGSGKSSLLNIIGMLDTPSEGSYQFMDTEVYTLKEKHRSNLYKTHIGFVFQAYHLIDELTVYENIETPLIYQDVKSSERKAIVADILDRFQMVGKKDLFPTQLSGGQQQLVGIARALVEFNAELRGPLKKAGLLTRDPREHERKKYGQKGARKRFQFSKR